MESFISIDLAFAKTLLHRFKDVDESAGFFLMNLMAYSRLGHLCIPLAELDLEAQKGAKLLPAELIEYAPKALPQKPIVCLNNHYYLQQNYYFETKVLHEIKRISKQTITHIEGEIEKSSLTDEQREAIIRSLGHPLSIISGGPGRGKTYVAAHLVKTFLSQKKGKIILTAPTGKAALRLKESLQKHVSFTNADIKIGTLHSLLGIKREDDFACKEFFFGADLVIVDEASMIDIKLFSALLSSIQEDTRVLLLGDENQLPPVESGMVFSEICDYAKQSSLLGFSHLTQCMRTSRKEIIDLADRVLESKSIPFQPLEESLPASFWQYAHSLVFSRSLEEAFKLLGTYQILSCLRKGEGGTNRINQKILEQLLVEDKELSFLPIMITKNDYRLGLTNGEVGILQGDMAHFPQIKGEIPKSLLPPYEYAFVLSVHKSQGSEFDHVVVLVSEGSENFGKEILYTAITRAKKSVQILANKEVLQTCLQQKIKKKSLLCNRLL